jgi:hypothetical protein
MNEVGKLREEERQKKSFEMGEPSGEVPEEKRRELKSSS